MTAGHEHHGGAVEHERPLWRAFGLTAGCLAAEVVGGLLTNSLAILSWIRISLSRCKHGRARWRWNQRLGEVPMVGISGRTVAVRGDLSGCGCCWTGPSPASPGRWG